MEETCPSGDSKQISKDDLLVLHVYPIVGDSYRCKDCKEENWVRTISAAIATTPGRGFSGGSINKRELVDVPRLPFVFRLERWPSFSLQKLLRGAGRVSQAMVPMETVP